MNGKILGGAVLLMAAFSLSAAQASTCAVPPTCAQLGYTMKKADCGEMPIMRCPFALSDDNQVYCEGTVKVAALPILYGDGTVSNKLVSGKTPIGVVFDETNRLAVALTDVKKDGSAGSEVMHWSDNSYDIPNLENCEMESCGVDGRANTDKILACGSGCGGTPAATACNLYQPTGCTKDFCKKGKWFLPSMRDLNNIYLQKGSMNLILMFLTSLGGMTLTEHIYWSSNEKDKDSAEYMVIINGYRFSLAKNNSYYIRPIVKY